MNLPDRAATFVACLLAFASSLVLIGSAQIGRGTAAREFVAGHEAVAGEVLVKLRDFANLTEIEQELDADRSERLGRTNLRRIHSRGQSVAVLLSRLANRGDVEYAEPNYIVHTTSLPNDTLFSQLWGLFNPGGSNGKGGGALAGADINVTPAWDLTTGSTANVVGVIDTGIDYTHPDLANNVWSAPAAFSVEVISNPGGGTSTINCAQGTHGFNAINNTCDPRDDEGHGTHVSGTVGAVGNNARGVVGVNQVASIMGLKFLDDTGSGSSFDAIKTIEFAKAAKAAFSSSGLANVRVLSSSWGGGGFSQALLDAITSANASDMLFVAAAGNSGSNNDSTPFYPANYDAPNVIAVAATDSGDNLASFSSYGRNTVHLAAPGVSIVSTTPGNSYGSASGTSMATPHVSGAAALLLSRCSLSTANLKTVILTYVQPIAALAPKTITGGRLNVYGSMLGCNGSGNTPPTVTMASPGGSYVEPATIPLSATANDSNGIQRVEFYQGATLIATSASTSNPYTASWPNVVAGSYTLTAKAYDTLNASTVSAPVSVTVSPGTSPTSQTLLTTQVPTATAVNDGVPRELGVRVIADVAGQIVAVKFWKSASETGPGPHVGRIWGPGGKGGQVLLSSVTFTNETASGWQEQALATPLAVTANTEYVVSVNTQNFYVSTQQAFASGLVNGHLRAPAGGNGVFGAPGAFPTSSNANSNYFRDVVFVAVASPPPPPPPPPK